MEYQPIIETQRLILRPFGLGDCTQVQLLAGDIRVADVTAHIPLPYPDGLAREWISSHGQKWKDKTLVAYAITIAETDLLIGCISLMNIKNSEAELGYWVGVKHWGNGYCTEACTELVKFGIENFGLVRFYACHLTRNPASGKVLMKSGFSHIGSGKSIFGFRSLEERIEEYELKIA